MGGYLIKDVEKVIICLQENKHMRKWNGGERIDFDDLVSKLETRKPKLLLVGLFSLVQHWRLFIVLSCFRRKTTDTNLMHGFQLFYACVLSLLLCSAGGSMHGAQEQLKIFLGDDMMRCVTGLWSLRREWI